MAIGLAEAGADIIGVSASLDKSGSDVEKVLWNARSATESGFSIVHTAHRHRITHSQNIPPITRLDIVPLT